MARNTFRLTLLSLSMGMAFAAPAYAAGPQDAQRDAAIARLSSDTGGEADVKLHSATGTARFVRLAPPAAQAGAQSRRAPPTDEAHRSSSNQFLSTYGHIFGVKNPASELGPAQLTKDRQGGTHLTHKQFYRGLPVFGSELKTHFDAAGTLTVANGTFIGDIDVNTTPSRSAQDAAQSATARVLSDLGRSVQLSTKAAKLMIYREGLAQGVPGDNHLAWQVEVGNGTDVREFVYVDAHTNKVIDKITGIHDAMNRRAFNGQNQTTPGPNYPNNPLWVEGQALPTGVAEADNMIYASGEIYNLFKNAFGRDSYDGLGARMDMVFNRGDLCPNASWNGTLISFCVGFTTDDVTAHEWGHAYTEYTHGLIYAWQPGALNEAYSDIWGETVDRLNGRGTDAPDALRTAGSCSFRTNATQVNITAPAAIAGVKSAGTAAFGPQTFVFGTTGIVVVNDGVVDPVAGASITDGCNVPFTNAAAIAGKIAYMDRGACGFAVKAKNAENAGAIGVIIGNNAAGAFNMAADPTITNNIPALSVLQATGTQIKSQAAGTVFGTMTRGPGSDNSVRWLMGEDVPSGALRDMLNPTCYGNPGKVSDTQYSCAAADNGGVHSNSGVPNHGYALTVDGGTYNGQTISPLGLTKAAHIYYRAQSVYQGPASSFADHADALKQSCTDLTGVNLNSLTTGAPSGEVINATDCQQIDKVALAVELRTPPTQCNFVPMLAKSPPAACPSGSPTNLLADSFDGGKKGGVKWTTSYVGRFPEFTPRNWAVVNNLPGGRAGYGIYATDYTGGNCTSQNEAGLQRLESPEITIPAGAAMTRLSFDHWMGSEAGYDGGNLKISVNGGAWQTVTAANFIYNAYNTTLTSAAAGNDNPLAGQPAFSGADGGSVNGSWGRSIINIGAYAAPGAKVKLRWEMSNDGCGGTFGWYLDDVAVYNCPAAP